MNKKKFEMMLLKNTLAYTVPALLVFCVLLFMFIKYPVFEQVECVKIGNIENVAQKLETLYKTDARNVKYVAKNLNYTGFDYYVDGKIKGAYYYVFNGNKIIMFLVKTEKPVMFIDEVVLKGRIIKDSISTEHIIKQFLDTKQIDEGLLESYCTEYVLSELDYPYAYIIMIWVCFIVPIIACVLIILYTIVIFFNPMYHSQAKQIEEYGEINEEIREIDNQLYNRLLFKKDSIYVTDDYMIVNYLTKTDVIKLDDIKYMSKNEIQIGRFFKKKMVYRLTLSDPERLFYEVDFESENAIDAVVDSIRGVDTEEKNK